MLGKFIEDLVYLTKEEGDALDLEMRAIVEIY